VRLAKIDIEGGEWALTAELSSQIARFDALLVELHPRWSSEQDEKAMYECLAGGRDLLLFDEERGATRRIHSCEEFRRNVEHYYFASLAAGRLPDVAPFTWQPAGGPA
jgi:hypothetical protein